MAIKVKMNKNLVFKGKTLEEGKEYQVENELAAKFIQKGYADEVFVSALDQVKTKTSTRKTN